MKLFFFFLVSILLPKVFTDALSVSNSIDSLAHQMDGVATGEALLKKSKHPRINCSQACSRRCSKASRKNLCQRACKTCCARCNCVPPGTYGNKEVCPCYANMKTRGNKSKCP